MSTIKQHQEMGYDRSAGMFSPDGLILQVEYAEKAVNLGSTVMGITTKEGVILIGDRRIKSKLLVKDSFKKVFEIDEHIAVTGAGAMSDGRRLIEEAQGIAQKHKVSYQNPIDTLSLVKDVANIQQYYSQAGGLRPFGVSFLIGGYEEEKGYLYQTTPSGMYIRFLAYAIGSHSLKANEKLEEVYKEDMKTQDAIVMGLKVFKEVLGEDYSYERFDIATITKEGFNRISTSDIKKLS
jgi:proteasome alpha subunit